MTKVQFKVRNEIITLNETVLTNLPKDSLLYNLIYNDAFAKEQDQDGNFVLLNQEITPEIFQMIAEYVESKDIATLMIKSYSCRIALLDAINYLGLLIPNELQKKKDLQDLLDVVNTKDIVWYEQFREKIFRDNYQVISTIADSLISKIMTIAKEMNELPFVSTTERVGFKIRYNFMEEFEIYLSYKSFSVETKFKLNPSKYQSHTRLCLLLTDIFLNVIWGLGLSYKEIEEINSDSAFLTASQILK
ncbi:hypothetical protein HK103_006077 [Boothiomyces macroporosus]|uniref:Uncharacterized protein n=1 Tax=Boothiomyces macroporosus TaxID=261099 RepID=A0AAD5UEL4_9FUNG|nr:hypothetical protein HK103_006077 [Boothiomyces macroporosus]